MNKKIVSKHGKWDAAGIMGGHDLIEWEWPVECGKLRSAVALQIPTLRGRFVVSLESIKHMIEKIEKER